MAGKTFNVGVVGYGMSAKIFHIPFITTTPSLRLHAIVQRTPKDGDSAPADYPDLRHFNDAKDLLADAETDVIVITTPPDSHFALTKAALESGKHVLTEKPFVPTAAQAEQLVATSARTGRLICVYQNRRWDGDFLTLKHLVGRGTLGRVVEFNTHFDRYRAAAPTNWKGQLDVSRGGSALFDLGTHLIDQAYTLFGMPRSARGRLVNQREGRADHSNPDAVSAQLYYDDGLMVNVGISALSAETTQPRFWVRGTAGSFRAHGLDPQEDQLKAGLGPTDPGFGADDASRLSLALVGDNGAISAAEVPHLEPETYKAFYAGFAAALASGKDEDVPVKASEARDVLTIIEGVLESSKTGKDAVFS